MISPDDEIRVLRTAGVVMFVIVLSGTGPMAVLFAASFAPCLLWPWLAAFGGC